MSPDDFRMQRLHRNEARKLVSKIVNQSPHGVIFSRHAMEELEHDDLSIADALNVLKSPDSKIAIEGEMVNGSFRYRLETAYLMVVVAFRRDGSGLTIVTVWDKRKR